MNASLFSDVSFKLEAGPRLRTLVAERIRSAIANNRFPPGFRLIERELCELLGVSRTSVREALRELESEGLISSRGGRLIVAVVDAREAAEIYQVRMALESLAARLFARNATTEQVAALETAFKSLAAACEDYESSTFLAAKTRFYEALFKGAGNEVAASMLRTIHAKVSQLRAASLSSPGRAGDSVREIRELVGALKARDEERAAQLTVRHIENARQVAMRVQNQAPPIPQGAAR